ncbi:MAG: hypothetical protein J6S81_05445, partial [Treponema sp.]|nr:hypothetical protein [Treponema sp.]
ESSFLRYFLTEYPLGLILNIISTHYRPSLKVKQAVKNLIIEKLILKKQENGLFTVENSLLCCKHFAKYFLIFADTYKEVRND